MQNKAEINIWKEVVNKLIENNFTIATMESCTGGKIACEITNIPGASEILKESFITYCNDAKIKFGVSKEVIEKYTVYSSETAVEMCKAAKKQANSLYGIGVTGELGRIDPNNQVDKLNHVWFAIVNEKDECDVKEINAPNGERKEQKEFISNQIAKELLRILKENRKSWIEDSNEYRFYNRQICTFT